MNLKLKNSPIVEVACEFKFEDVAEDLTIYGDFQTKLGVDFNKKAQKTYQDIVIKRDQNKIEQTFNDYKLQQFINDKENSMVQVGQNILTVNKLKPYESWEQFFPLINDSFKNFIEIAQLKKIKRIGLRYINQINFSEDEIKLEDYLLFRPEINDKLGPIAGHLITGAEFLENNEKDLLRIILTNTPPVKRHKVALLLDFDCSTIKLDNLTTTNALDWVENAHNEIKEAFFNCITNKLKGIFEK